MTCTVLTVSVSLSILAGQNEWETVDTKVLSLPGKQNNSVLVGGRESGRRAGRAGEGG